MKPRGHDMHGITLVELLVGLALGLLVIAAASAWLAAALHEQRRLALEGRLVHELRAAADLATRELRRAGHWGAAPAGVWTPGASVRANPYAALALGADVAVAFRYSRDTHENDLVDSHEEAGLRLRRNVLELQLGAGNWQALTDPATLSVSDLSITPLVHRLSLEAACNRPCPPGSTTCPPRLEIRTLALTISGHPPGQPTLRRELRSHVRLRNDAVSGACAD